MAFCQVTLADRQETTDGGAVSDPAGHPQLPLPGGGVYSAESAV